MNPKLKELVGKRVKIIKGDPSHTYDIPELPYVRWIAGCVPVGSFGTIVKHSPYRYSFPHICIHWDDPEIIPKPGYCFMITEDSDDFLEISDAPSKSRENPFTLLE